MEGLDRDAIQSLLDGPRKSRPIAGPRAWLSDGTVVPLRKAVTEKVGAYEGKQGTSVRSRKGRTYRKANGRRYYVEGNLDIVAYKV